MSKNILIVVVFAMFSTASVSAFAVSNVTNNVGARALTVVNATNNEAVLLQEVIKSGDIAKNVISQPKFQSAEKSGSAFSTEWLFVVALFWFVILSNRRGV